MDLGLQRKRYMVQAPDHSWRGSLDFTGFLRTSSYSDERKEYGFGDFDQFKITTDGRLWRAMSQPSASAVDASAGNGTEASAAHPRLGRILARIAEKEVIEIDDFSSDDLAFLRETFTTYTGEMPDFAVWDRDKLPLDRTISKAIRSIAPLCIGKESGYIIRLFGRPMFVTGLRKEYTVGYRLDVTEVIEFQCHATTNKCTDTRVGYVYPPANTIIK